MGAQLTKNIMSEVLPPDSNNNKRNKNFSNIASNAQRIGSEKINGELTSIKSKINQQVSELANAEKYRQKLKTQLNSIKNTQIVKSNNRSLNNINNNLNKSVNSVNKNNNSINKSLNKINNNIKKLNNKA